MFSDKTRNSFFNYFLFKNIRLLQVYNYKSYIQSHTIALYECKTLFKCIYKNVVKCSEANVKSVKNVLEPAM